MASVLKTEGLEIVPWVRIPHSPPICPIGEMNITSCYEREVGSLILSLGARVWRVARVVMEWIANPSSRNRCTGSNPVLSARLCSHSLMVERQSYTLFIARLASSEGSNPSGSTKIFLLTLFHCYSIINV